MLYIYGDSHANYSFKNLTLNHINCYQNSITMFRIGRDNHIVNFDKSHDITPNIICLSYGEVDCRCHIQRQINNDRKEDNIINELVTNYFNTIKNNIKYAQVIVIGIIPPTKQNDFESIHGPILHEFPFIGNDKDRVRYTKKMNGLIELYCKEYNYIYFNAYDYYESIDGTLKYELSDSSVHIGDNTFFINKFKDLNLFN